MTTHKHFTGIGSRQTPASVLALMTEIASQLASSHWTLRSGHADGADKAFEAGALSAGGSMEIYLPWAGFNKAPRDEQHIVPPMTDELLEIAARFHPNWNACKQGAQKMHARNVCQIAGLDLCTASQMVICWTPEGSGSGGTGQALRIAKHLNIPIFDLGSEASLQALIEFVNQKDA